MNYVVFVLGLAYGICVGLTFWCRDMFMQEWRRAVQQSAAT